MSQIDYRKELSPLYNPSARQPGLIDLPPLNFLVIDGAGKPDKQEFQEAASTVYPVAYTLKFMVRKSHDLDFKVMPMEVRWFVNREKKEFKWTMMIMQPEVITSELYAEAVAAVKAKGGAPLLAKLRFENFAEGRCAQMMHKGPYPEMENTLEIMLKFIHDQGYTTDRRTHDIYLNSILKARPENLKTVMRVQVTPA
jgi:hypothetical protein